MKPLLIRWRRDKSGAAAVEFALVAPVLLVCIFGIVELGRLYFVRSSLQYAADEAGRYAMVYTAADAGAIQTRFQQNLIAVPSPDVTFSVQTQTVSSIDYKQITASYNFTSAVGALLGWGTIPLTVSTTVPVMP